MSSPQKHYFSSVLNLLNRLLSNHRALEDQLDVANKVPVDPETILDKKQRNSARNALNAMNRTLWDYECGKYRRLLTIAKLSFDGLNLEARHPYFNKTDFCRTKILKISYY